MGQVKTILSILDQEEITQEQIENIKKQKESIRMNHPDKLPGIFLQMLDTIILSLESMEFQKIVVEGCPPEKVHNGKKSEEMKE